VCLISFRIVTINAENSSGSTVPLTLSNVYHLLALLINLLLGTYIQEHSAYMCKRTNTIQQIENDYEIAAIDVVACHLLLQQKGVPIAMPIGKGNPKVSFCTWHRWLRHISLANV
jgi:hypothetical protein